MNEKIVVFGGGGHAKSVISVIKKLGKYEIIGYTDKTNNGLILNTVYLGNDNEFLSSDYEVKNAVIGIGQNAPLMIKKSLVEKLKKLGFKFPSIISNFVSLGDDVTIGEGCILLDFVNIGPSTKIDNFVVIYPHCSIQHNCHIFDWTYLAPGVNLCSEIIIEENSVVGNGSSIREGTKIASNSKFPERSIIT